MRSQGSAASVRCAGNPAPPRHTTALHYRLPCLHSCITYRSLERRRAGVVVHTKYLIEYKSVSCTQSVAGAVARSQQMAELTEASLISLVEGLRQNTDYIVQLLEYRLIQWKGKQRYRLYLSDGVFKTNFVLLARNLNYKNHLFEDFSIWKIRTHIISKCGSAKRLLIVDSLEKFCNFDDLHIKYLDFLLKKIDIYGNVEQSLEPGAEEDEDQENVSKRRRICGK